MNTDLKRQFSTESEWMREVAKRGTRPDSRLVEAETLLKEIRGTYKYLTAETIAKIDAFLARSET